MTTIYLPYVGFQIDRDGVCFLLQEGVEERVGDRVYVRQGKTLYDERDHWHETRTAAMDEAAVRIEALAERLQAQAHKIRREAEVLRAAAEVKT